MSNLQKKTIILIEEIYLQWTIICVSKHSHQILVWKYLNDSHENILETFMREVSEFATCNWSHFEKPNFYYFLRCHLFDQIK